MVPHPPDSGVEEDSLSMRATALLPWLLLAALPAAAVLQGQTALVVTRERRIDDVRITQDDLRGVEGRQGTARLSWPAGDIVRIEYQVAPESWAAAWRLWSEGRFREAAERFETAARESAKPAWLAAYAAWYRGECLRRLGAAAEARACFEALLTLDPKPRFVPDALLALADLRLAEGPEGTAEARRLLEQLQALVSSASLPERYARLAELGLARVELRAAPERAVVLFLALAGRSAAHPDIARDARLGIGAARTAAGDYVQAEAHYRSLLTLAGTADPALLAGAANGLGDCFAKQEKWADALLAYSRTYVLALDQPALRDRVAYALVHGGRAFLAEAARLRASDAAKADRYGRRGAMLLRRAALEYEDTPDGAQARKDLGR